MSKRKFFYWDRLLSLLTCLLLMATVALQKNGRLLGHDVEELFSPSNAEAEVLAGQSTDTLQMLPDGEWIVHTRPLAPKVIGFGGPTPLNIHIRNGRIEAIDAEPNSETPDFFNNATAGLFPRYIGQTVEEALSAEIDAVSGATYSSMAIRENMKRGLAFVQPRISDQPVTLPPASDSAQPVNIWKLLAGVLVVVMGAVLPFWLKGKAYRWIQLLLNVVLLGCWCGTFVSYSLIVNSLSNGVNLTAAIVVLLMLVVAFLFPLFGRSRHYCMWICPLGAAQEVVGRLVPVKWKIGPRTMKWLSGLRWTLWAVLMLLMVVGVWFDWMDYELFSVFVFSQASWVVIVLAALFGVLSAFVSRPYCRFLCPTGCLFQAAENKKLEAQM